MFNFGDDLIIESFRIPWLIWIQLLAMFLIVIILYYLTTAPSDLSITFPASTATATATAGSTSTSRLSYVNHPLLTTAGAIAADYRNSKVGENQIRETGASTSRVDQRSRREDIQRREASATKDEGSTRLFEHSHHPCHIFGLAKQAFLKCLGFDSAPENSSSRKHEKES